MGQINICQCPEPAAHRLDEPMHTHDGCAVYHTGATCAIQEGTMKSLPEIVKANGKDRDGFENVDGNPTARRARKVAKAFAPSAARPRDQHLPGLEPKTIPAVHKAIEEYVVARDNRMELTKIEVEKKAVLLAAMKAAGIKQYGVDGHRAEMDVEETVKAKIDPEEVELAEEDKIRGVRPKDHLQYAVNPPPARKGRGKRGEPRA